jgi:hypothetical protein
MDGSDYLTATRGAFAQLRASAEQALAQLDDDAFYAAPAPDSNSAAVLVKHMAGNLRSRWTDFLTTDGEKPDRDRDGEFEIGPGDDRVALMSAWRGGWDVLEATLAALDGADLRRTVRIRGERSTALEAAQRQLAHAAVHVGQIIYVARLLSGAKWRTLSIPRGGSAAYNAAIGYDPTRPD